MQEALNPLNQQADQVLQHPQGVVNNIPFQDVFDAVKSRIAKLNINPTEQKAAIRLAQQNIMDTAEKYGTEATISLQLHDAIYIICKKEEVEDWMEKMRACMMIPLTCNGEEFKIDVDFAIGESWGTMEEV